MDLVAAIVFSVGSLFVLLAGVGVMRFPDTMSRMHAAAKAPVLGFMLIGIGVIVSIGTWAAAAVVVLAVVLQMIAVPVGSHVLARSIYHRMHPHLDGPDDLAVAIEQAARAAEEAAAETAGGSTTSSDDA